jgi:hypothetical protein
MVKSSIIFEVGKIKIHQPLRPRPKKELYTLWCFGVLLIKRSTEKSIYSGPMAYQPRTSRANFVGAS